MATERKPGLNSGRPATDWNKAFLYYGALPPDQRSYRIVAEKFRLSVRTVEGHGCKEHWKQRAQQLDREAADAAGHGIVEQRAKKLIEFEKLIEASTLSYQDQLRQEKVKMSPRDLATLYKLLSELWARADTTSAETAEPPTPVDPIDTAERKLQVLRALHEVGALDGLLQLEQHENAGAGDGQENEVPEDVDRADDGVDNDQLGSA